MKKLRNWLISGIAVILPIAVSIFVLLWLFNFLDNILAGPVTLVFGRKIPGVGLAALILILLLVGMFTSNLIGKRIAKWFHELVERLPIVGSIYKPVSKISSSFSSEKSKSFQSVVTVDFPTKGITSIGFITNDDVSFAGDDKVCVFIPTTPNPTNGFLVFVEKEQVMELDMTVAEGLNMVVSLGAAVQGDIKNKSLHE